MKTIYNMNKGIFGADWLGGATYTEWFCDPKNVWGYAEPKDRRNAKKKRRMRKLQRSARKINRRHK